MKTNDNSSGIEIEEEEEPQKQIISELNSLCGEIEEIFSRENDLLVKILCHLKESRIKSLFDIYSKVDKRSFGISLITFNRVLALKEILCLKI